MVSSVSQSCELLKVLPSESVLHETLQTTLYQRHNIIQSSLVLIFFQPSYTLGQKPHTRKSITPQCTTRLLFFNVSHYMKEKNVFIVTECIYEQNTKPSDGQISSDSSRTRKNFKKRDWGQLLFYLAFIFPFLFHHSKCNINGLFWPETWNWICFHCNGETCENMDPPVGESALFKMWRFY